MLGSFSFISYFLNKIKIQDKYPGLTYKWWPVRDSNPWMHAWKACELTVSPTGHGAWSRTRTYDRSVNSRLLYQLSYSSVWSGWWESNPRSQLGRLKFYHWTTPAFHFRYLYILTLSLYDLQHFFIKNIIFLFATSFATNSSLKAK